MPRGRLPWAGLILTLLVVAACSSANPATLSRLASGGDLLAAPTEQPRAPIAPRLWPSPYPSYTPTPVPVTPTARPSPTPLPTATPIIPLEAMRKTPAPATTVLGHGLQLPPGFKVAAYSQGVESVLGMALSPDGFLFVTLPTRGAVLALPDTNGDGQADRMVVVAQGLANPTGLAFAGDYLYVAETNEIVRYRYAPGQLSPAGDPEVVVRGLPVGNGFNNHALSFGPDGKLYVSVGASCNACKESDFRRATILRYDLATGREEVFAQGLRDVEGLAWWPQSTRLLATNSSRRGMGDNLPPDTLEDVVAGANYGWPFCHAGDVTDPQLGWEKACDAVPRPLWELPAHTTPGGVCFYAGAQFPRDYFGNIFVALRGSWERSVPVGYEIVRLKVQEGKIVSGETFASGWLVFGQAWGRPANLLQAPDGSLLVADDRVGAVYRIYYTGG